MTNYSLYKRIEVGHGGRLEREAWQLDICDGGGRDVLHQSSFSKHIGLPNFATEVAEMLNGRHNINHDDLITTVEAPVYIPTNNYIDLPLKGEDLILFWKVYEQRKKELVEVKSSR